MTEITIKFKDRNRSDLKLKVPQDYYVDYNPNGLVRIPIATNGKVCVVKVFSADIIEEMTEVRREDKGDLK